MPIVNKMPLVKLVAKLKVICRGNNQHITKVPYYSLSTAKNGVFKRYRAWLMIVDKTQSFRLTSYCCKPITALPSYNWSIIRKATLHCLLLLKGYRLCAC